MPTCYRYQDKEYSSFFELHKALTNISFPANLTGDVLSELGIEIVKTSVPEPPFEGLQRCGNNT